MAKSCKGLAAELVKCLSESDCVKVQNRPYRECAKEKTPSISTECVGLRETYFNCKRGQKRIPTYDGCVCDQTKILNKSITQCRKGSHLRWDKRSDVDMRARIRGNKGY
ncbi:unnamed protein product [Cuscuta europaea]|uniref:Cytochrome c oxidase assembly factor 5 n=1 Tax=Cuscuta europaea TaxID=41803 RepID=A0A9P0ZVT5_CUSEU|nr:unnamed protein product [Cuscuta europaea]